MNDLTGPVDKRGGYAPTGAPVADLPKVPTGPAPGSTNARRRDYTEDHATVEVECTSITPTLDEVRALVDACGGIDGDQRVHVDTVQRFSGSVARLRVHQTKPHQRPGGEP